ncbi:DUF3918 family protein [Ureibacillus acetophenoni]
MKANMGKIIPILSAIGVGIAAYQVFSGNGGGKMKNMMPLASNMMMGTGMQGQNQQQ